ncbi:hypothetical protein EVA_17112 [gut metagenome]|uniref:Uncharacterized protein n=1 Tax=gut metagenome TaxID=749906 RepID=J9FYZ9_9ZZZZ
MLSPSRRKTCCGNYTTRIGAPIITEVKAIVLSILPLIPGLSAPSSLLSVEFHYYQLFRLNAYVYLSKVQPMLKTT